MKITDIIGLWIAVACVPLVAVSVAFGAQTADRDDGSEVGKRPYELDWAGRTRDDHPPLIDFEDLTGWTVATRNAAATFARSREQQIWGRYVGKLVYRADGPAPNEVRVVPPNPIPIGEPFDAVTLWCYGNNWGYAPDPQTPQVGVMALFLDADGNEFGIHLYNVIWTEWFLLHRRLTPEQIERVRRGASFAGLLITGCRQKDDRVLYFDNLAVFTEKFEPLTFAPRPQRGVSMFPGQGSGTNTGPGKLPFPTNEKTILPPVSDPRLKLSAKAEDTGARFAATDRTGILECRVTPRTGLWTDIEVVWRANPSGPPTRFRPCVDGGVYLRTPTGAAKPDRAELIKATFADGVLTAVWRAHAGDVSAEVTYRYRIWGKSLVIDVIAVGGAVAEVRYGRAEGLKSPRLATHPFYPADGGRPATVAFDGPSGPLFLMGNTDWCRTNASTMWATNAVEETGVVYNGGTRYTPLTDGRTNDCFERFFLTVSPLLEECLPSIPNPPSPWKRITGTHVWRPHGAGDRASDKRFWSDIRRHGITEMVVTDHETMWRDGGESFTFRTRTAPGKGGDEGAREYSRFMQDTLGFVYGPYNNFTDFAPVNEYWSPDLIARDPQNQLQHAWFRCYAPKPARAVEYCERLSPINQAKFGFSTAYCDVHTAVAPWHRVDYDPRVPGAGAMAAVFYSYGEIMLHQKKAWNGPVYSEGNYHAFYCGLTDGNYGQDQAYRPAENPWLVDFDLRRMHDLACNFGMGAPDMFYANVAQPQATREERDAWLDRFLAATAAFGHPGFLVTEGGMANAMKSYYMLQQLHSRYCLARATDIRYADAEGRLLTTSEAVASGAYRRSQVVVRYADGTVVAANGSKTSAMAVTAYGRKIRLLPNGYCGWTKDGLIEVTNQSPTGGHADYSISPEYMFVDGRGKFTRFANAASDGPAVCRRIKAGEWEVIPLNGAQCGFAVSARSATALDRERNPLGRAELRISRGLTYIMPVKGAYSYLLRGVRVDAPQTLLRAARTAVTPGETVVVQGRKPHRVIVPEDAAMASRIWSQLEGEWVDFTVVAPFNVGLSMDGHDLVVKVSSRLPNKRVAEVSAFGVTRRIETQPGKPTEARLPLGAPNEEAIDLLSVRIQSGRSAGVEEVGMVTRLVPKRVAALPDSFLGGVGLRGKADTTGFGTTGAFVAWGAGECGGAAKQCLKMHPPWLSGAVGRTYALFDPVTLPAGVPAALRASVGKLDGSDLGDGILYEVYVLDETGAETLVGTHTVRSHRWEPMEADMTRWAGKTVRLRLVLDPGRRDDSSGDWGCWADMRIETLRPEWTRELDARPDLFRRRPGPFPIEGLTLEEVRSARRGRLRFDGKGLNAGSYASEAILNGVPIGSLPEAGGDEALGVFAENVALELPKDAVAALANVNRLVIRNPNRDYFSVRRFWIELDLADGRKCSSSIADVTFTQPPEWPHAEGVRVPFGTDIEVIIAFGSHRGRPTR